jgi:hypothetical protein
VAPRAHVTWFFETFVLERYDPAFRAHRRRGSAMLFNSYYDAVGPSSRPAHERGLITRPARSRRPPTTAAPSTAGLIRRLLETRDDPEIAELIELGLQHEQQHQELLLTDIKHAASRRNPLRPVYTRARRLRAAARTERPELEWVELRWRGAVEIGHDGGLGLRLRQRGAHGTTEMVLEPFAIADRPGDQRRVPARSSRMAGTSEPELWLDDGLALGPRRNASKAPLYWSARPRRGWVEFTLRGEQTARPRSLPPAM